MRILTKEELQVFCDGIRSMCAADALTQLVQATREMRSRPPTLREEMQRYQYKEGSDDNQVEGQHHLELDESTIESTGKSVSVDEVIAKINELTDS